MDELAGLKEYEPTDIRCVVHNKGELGHGAFGVVRCAFHDILHSIAVKCFVVSGGDNQKQLIIKQLKNELQLLQKANHENVLRVYGWAKWTNSLGLIMEYMPGGNLWNLLNDHDVDLLVILRLRISSETADGIAFIHNLNEARRLIHGDLKPENILLTKDLHCKIADCGGATLMKYTRSASTSMNDPERQHLTRIYAAPERHRRCRLKKEQDTYSYSLIVHGVLSREMPDADFLNEDDYVDMIIEGERPDQEKIEELKRSLATDEERSIIATLESVMFDCWQQRPEDRPDMLDVRDKLNELLIKQNPADIQLSVATALRKMNLFMPSEREFLCVPLLQFDTSTQRFYEGHNPLAASEGATRQSLDSLSIPPAIPPVDAQAHPTRNYTEANTLAIDVSTQRPSSRQSDLKTEEQVTDRVRGASATSDSAAVASISGMNSALMRDDLHDHDRASVSTMSSVPSGSRNVARGTRQAHTVHGVAPPTAAAASTRSQAEVHARETVEENASARTKQAAQQERPLALAHGRNAGLTPSPSLSYSARSASDGPRQDRTSASASDGNAEIVPDSAIAVQPQAENATSRFVVVGGDISSQQCTSYDVNTAASKAFPNLQVARIGAVAAKVGRHLYVVGGHDGSGSIHRLANVLSLDREPAQWEPVPQIRKPRAYAACAVLGECLYVTGGKTSDVAILALSEKYDCKLKKWSKLKTMLEQREKHGMVAFKGSLWCFGGISSRGVLNSTEVYNSRNDKWEQAAPMRNRRCSFGSTVYKGYIYATGGFDGNEDLAVVERYNDNGSVWEITRPMLNSRSAHGAFVGGDCLYVVGGHSNSTRMEVYSERSERWRSCPEISVGARFSAILLL